MEYKAHIAAIFAMMYEVCNGYCDELARETVGTILHGVDGEYNVEIGYFNLILKENMVAVVYIIAE